MRTSALLALLLNQESRDEREETTKKDVEDEADELKI
jgi:hypothetical protein